MKSFAIVITLCCSYFQITKLCAFELPNSCKTEVYKDCQSCDGPVRFKSAPDLGPKNLNHTLEIFAKFSYLDEKVEKLDLANTALKKSLAPLMRALRDGSSEPTYRESMAEIARIRQDFDRLVVLSKESMILQKKFNACLHNCSATHRLEISDDLSHLQRLKTALFLKRPVLANDAFEKRLSDIKEDDFFPDVQFRNDLKEALFSNLQSIDQRSRSYFNFLNDGKRPFSKRANEEYIQDYLNEVTSRFPSVVDDLLMDADFSEKSSPSCFFARELNKYQERKQIIDKSVDAGLFILPLFTGGIGRVGTTGLELALGKKLATWGVSSLEAQNALKNVSVVLNIGLLGKDTLELKDLSYTCKRAEIDFIKGHAEKDLIELRKCQEDLGEKVLMSELQALGLAFSHVGPSGLKLLPRDKSTPVTSLALSKNFERTDEMSGYLIKRGLDDLKKGEVAIEYKTADRGTFSIMDLKNVLKNEDPEIRKIPEEYWRYVSSVYSERLNLSKEEIENFIKSSVEMGPRTKLVLNTEGSVLKGKAKINGGVGVIESKGSLEPLPLEKANGIKLERRAGEKVVEIVRLTVGKNADAEKLSKDLIAQVNGLIVHDKEISRIFIFTSKVHARLYKRMGVPADKIKELDKRDVIIEFTRSDLERVMENKLAAGAS